MVCGGGVQGPAHAVQLTSHVYHVGRAGVVLGCDHAAVELVRSGRV